MTADDAGRSGRDAAEAVAQARDASLAVLARAAIDGAVERRDAARAKRSWAELTRLERAAGGCPQNRNEK
jgi:hypothetical protein